MQSRVYTILEIEGQHIRVGRVGDLLEIEIQSVDSDPHSLLLSKKEAELFLKIISNTIFHFEDFV